MRRRSFLETAIGGGLLLGGCLEPESSPTVKSTPPDTKTPVNTDFPIVSGEGEYPHPIRVENALNRDVTLTIAVSRESTKLYQDKRTITAQTDAIIAGITKESLQGESRSVTVSATDSEGHETSVNVTISECLGDILFMYGPNEKLQSTYAIC